MGEQVEVVEDHPQLTAHLAQLGGTEPPMQLFAADPNRAAARGFEVVEAANERALARAARPDDSYTLATLDGEIDVVQHLALAKDFAEAAHVDHQSALALAGRRFSLRRRGRPLVLHGGNAPVPIAA